MLHHPFTIVAYGEVLWDLLPTGPVLGGAPFNFACRAAGLGDRSVMVSRLGRDERGKSAMKRISELGVETARIQWDDERPTGTVPVTLDARGIPDYFITPDAAYDRIKLWLSKSEVMPVRGEYYSESGKMLRMAEFSLVKTFTGIKRPSRVVMKNMLAQKRFSEIVIEKMNVKVKPSQSQFVLDNLGR